MIRILKFFCLIGLAFLLPSSEAYAASPPAPTAPRIVSETLTADDVRAIVSDLGRMPFKDVARVMGIILQRQEEAQNNTPPGNGK